MTKFECNVNQLNKRWEACTPLERIDLFPVCMLLPSKDIVGYISSIPIYFDCHVILQQNEEYHLLQFLFGKNVHASDYDPVVETFFIDFNIIRIMSEVMVDYVSVSLFCCCWFFCLFFHFRIIRTYFIAAVYVYEGKKMRSLSLILKIVSACN